MSIAIKKWIAKLVIYLVPLKTRRMLLLASVLSGVEQIEDEKIIAERLIDLNARLKLATNQDSLYFALEVGKILWTDLKEQFQMMHDDYHLLTKAIMNNCPSSLRYADEQTMYNDIYAAIQCSIENPA